MVPFLLEPKAECNWAVIQGVGILLIRYLEHSDPNHILLASFLISVHCPSTIPFVLPTEASQANY